MSNNYKNPKPNIIYISPSLDSFGQKNQKIRIATKLLPNNDGYEFAKIRDEVVIRKKEAASTLITAKFFEDSREKIVLSIQKYSSDTGNPYGAGFSFIGDEITELCSFLSKIESVTLKNTSPLTISNKKTITEDEARKIIKDNQELISELIRSEITSADIISLGYRKNQLEIFKRLLEEKAYFENIKTRKNCTNEALWQQFFEKNSWIFGYGLGYIFLSNLEGKKLEQVVQGSSISSHGKRVDALMKTRGYISSLCFIEIKHNFTKLLESSPYRSGCWSPSKELSGAIAQIQGTVASAIDHISTRLNPHNNNGNPTGEDLYNYQPKSYIVIGSLEEFMSDDGINIDKLRSFELFRKNIFNPEIITFDELYQRAKFITQHNEMKD